MISFFANISDIAFGSSSHPFVLQWGQSGLTTHGYFLNPQNIAVDSDGNVYVTDLGNMRVQKFDNAGTFLNAWGSSGNGAGQFRSPAGIAIGQNNTVYVVDSELSRVQAFDANGSFILQWGARGSELGNLLLPNGIAIDGQNIYVVDTGNNRIQKFTPTGDFVKEFGKSGTNSGFILPIGITISIDGDIYVSDQISIKKFDSEGNFLDELNSNTGGSQIRAHGLQSDPMGNLYVADTGNNRILRLDSQGIATAIWGQMGIQEGKFKMPKDITLDSEGYLFVVDSNGHRIQKFSTPLVGVLQKPSTESLIEPKIDTEPEQEILKNNQYNLSPVNPILGDLTRPIITPPHDLTLEATGVLTSVNVGNAIVTDESGIQSLTSNAPDQFTLGTSTVIWTAIDGAGNMAVATQSVNIIDTIPPTILDVPNIILEAEHPIQNKAYLDIPIATDTVGVLSLENDAPEFFPIGQTIVNWTASDIAGNIASVQQIVDIIDTTIPVIHVPEDIIIEADSLNENNIFLGEASVIDNGHILSVTNDAPLQFGLGNTTVTWIASDMAGNIATSLQLVTIIDTTPPQITSNDVTFEATSVDSNIINLNLPDVFDIQNTTITNDAPSVFSIGTTVVNWLVTDVDGNNATLIQQVTVIDTTAPTFTAPKDILVEATGYDGNIVDLGKIIVEDISGIASIENDAPESFRVGNTTVTWVVMDNFENIATVSQLISVIDSTAPSIVPPSDIISEASNATNNFIDLGNPTIADIVELYSITNDAPLSYPIGMTTVTWVAVDTSGNSAIVHQTVTVRDTMPPIITPAKNIVTEAINSDTPVLLDDIIAIDTIGIDSITNNAPKVFKIGNTIVTWNATDLYGNSAVSTQNITIVDTTPPNLIAPDDIVIEAIDPLYNIVDIGSALADDIIGINSITNDALEFYPVGDTVITWTASDVAQNTVHVTQTITVIDTTPPTITAPDDLIVEALSVNNNTVSLGNVSVYDIVGIASVHNNAPKIFAYGAVIVTWNVTDTAGNSAIDTQMISIVDTTPPTLNIPSSIILEASNQFENIVEYGMATASDHVGIMTILNDAPPVFSHGLTPIIWTAIDISGNSVTGIQNITIVDTTKPLIIAPDDVILEASSVQSNIVNLGQAEASDTVLLDLILNDAPQVFSYGETIVTWTAIDISGNNATDTQNIMIIDTTSPTLVLPQNITTEATAPEGNIVQIGTATADDIIEISSLTNDAPDSFLFGNTTVTWTAVDQDGNTARSVQLVSVIDTTAPELIIPKNIIIDAIDITTPVDVGMATSIDMVDPDPLIENDAPESFPLGQSMITWVSTDMFGNSISATQNVDVQACGKPLAYYNMIMGSPENDIIQGTSQSDLIFSLEGDDIVFAGNGNDCIFGGEGNDIIFGQDGNDGIFGDDGNDILKGQSGIDYILGKSGNDVIDGGDDNDSCNILEESDADLVVKCEL